MGRFWLVGLVALGVLGHTAAVAEAGTIGPKAYTSFSDSPFKSGMFDYFHLEDFEDGSLNTPGVTCTTGMVVVGPPRGVDSVDADDGSIDGSGSGGYSYYSNWHSPNPVGSATFSFSESSLGSLPTHVGVVVTDIGNVPSGTYGYDDVTVSFRDASSAEVGSVGPYFFGDGLVAGQTAEDRFFGMANSGGIASMTITMHNNADWELDHVQYGYVVPLPAGAWMGLGLLGGITIVRRVRRRRAA